MNFKEMTYQDILNIPINTIIENADTLIVKEGVEFIEVAIMNGNIKIAIVPNKFMINKNDKQQRNSMIQLLYSKGFTQEEMSIMYGLSQASISKILNT